MEKELNKTLEFFPMNSEGPYNYSINSSYQQAEIVSTKTLIDREVSEKLDIKQLISSSKVFNIVDLGCSVGPNTFIVVQNIIDTIEHKHQSHVHSSEKLKFQIFFNDHVSNDFNTLFKSIPLEKQYFAAAAPGSFHGRLFPEASLHFVHSSYAINLLSQVPKEVIDESSPSWNKGRIYCNTKEAKEAYLAQHSKDIESFLKARAKELVCGGLMVLLFPILPSGAPPSQCILHALFDHLDSSLMDMAKMGKFDEAKVDTFNLPFYLPTKEEFEAMIERNGCFSTERIEPGVRPSPPATRPSIQKFTPQVRATFVGLIAGYFGSEIIDELFERFTKKIIDSCLFSSSNYKPFVDLFVCLKRNS